MVNSFVRVLSAKPGTKFRNKITGFTWSQDEVCQMILMSQGLLMSQGREDLMAGLAVLMAEQFEEIRGDENADQAQA